MKKKNSIESKSIPQETVNSHSQTKLLTKKDALFILIITLLYSILSFINLGTFSNPQTFWKTSARGDSAIFQIDTASYNNYHIRYYTGGNNNYNYGSYEVYFSTDNNDYIYCFTINIDSVYSWKDFDFVGIWPYMKLVATQDGMYMGELTIQDENGNSLPITPINENAKLLFDEKDTIPEEISFMNSTYFDEVYFPRTAYEHLHNLSPYEWVHPPLGKLLIAIPIHIFGMNPFAYRLMGNLAGILMIPTIYCLAKMLFRKSKYAVFAAIIMAVDGMHFVQTRIATVDSFLTLFIMLEYLFMLQYIFSEDKPFRKRLFLLFLSGLFMGAGICVKWSGVFAAFGLAFVFLAHLIIQVYKKKRWTKENTITILCCFVFFVLIPLVLYILCFIPLYQLENPYITNIQTFIQWQQAIYDYHHNLVATHPYTSMWYTWPITKQPVLYYTGTTIDGKISRIALLGNPAIFWFSIPCMLYTLIAAIKNRKFELWFCIIAIVCMFLPYLSISRIMFLYHYFPMLPFAMLTIVAFMKWLCEKIKTNIPIYLVSTLFIVVFIIFYPIYSGFPTSQEYLNHLQWLDTWVW